MDAWIIGNNLGIFVNYRVRSGSVQNVVNRFIKMDVVVYILFLFYMAYLI